MTSGPGGARCDLHADYQELDVAGGHVWFLVAAPQLRRRLAL
jgi:hypothetical protein